MAKIIADVNKLRNDRLDRGFDDYAYPGGTFGNRFHHLPPKYLDEDNRVRKLDATLGTTSMWMIGGRAVNSLNALSMSFVDPALWGPAPVGPHVRDARATYSENPRDSRRLPELPPLSPNPSARAENNRLSICTPTPRPANRFRSSYSENHNRYWCSKMLPHLRHVHPRKYRANAFQQIDIHKLQPKTHRGQGAHQTSL